MKIQLLTGILLGYLIYMILCPLPTKQCYFSLNQLQFGVYNIHVHHWLLSLMGLLILKIYNIKINDIVKGILMAGIIHGIMEYDDWNKFIYLVK